MNDFEKKTIKIVGGILVSGLMYGIIFPKMISVSNNELVIGGVLGLIIYTLILIFLFKRFILDKGVKKDEKN